MSLKPVTFRLPEDLLVAVDKRRGRLPRTQFVIEALEKALGPSSVSSAPDTVEQTGGRGSARPAPSRALLGKGAFKSIPKKAS